MHTITIDAEQIPLGGRSDSLAADLRSLVSALADSVGEIEM